MKSQQIGEMVKCHYKTVVFTTTQNIGKEPRKLLNYVSGTLLYGNESASFRLLVQFVHCRGASSDNNCHRGFT